jgi:hypothetical protein
MSSLREQCDFMSNVVQRAILMGMNHEQFAKLAETAWLVLTAEPASSEETPVEQCPRCPEERQHGAKRCAYCGREWFDRL